MSMSDDFRGLSEWWAGFQVPEREGEPAYQANFGWLPSPPPPVLVRPALIPLPRRACDDLL